MENCCVDAFRHACSRMLEACVFIPFFFSFVLHHSSSSVVVFSLIILICAHFSLGLCVCVPWRLVLDGFSGVRTEGHMRTVLDGRRENMRPVPNEQQNRIVFTLQILLSRRLSLAYNVQWQSFFCFMFFSSLVFVSASVFFLSIFRRLKWYTFHHHPFRFHVSSCRSYVHMLQSEEATEWSRKKKIAKTSRSSPGKHRISPTREFFFFF